MATLTEEDRRALAYQAKERRIAAARRSRVGPLAGDSGARARLRDAWEPLRLALVETRMHDDDPADDRDRE